MIGRVTSEGTNVVLAALGMTRQQEAAVAQVALLRSAMDQQEESAKRVLQAMGIGRHLDARA